MRHTKKVMFLSKVIVFFIWIATAWVIHFILSLIFGNVGIANNIFYFITGMTFSILMLAFEDVDKRV